MRIFDKITEFIGRSHDDMGSGFSPNLRQQTLEASVADAIKKKPYNKILSYPKHLFDKETCEAVAASPEVQKALLIRINQELRRKQSYRAGQFAEYFFASEETLKELRDSRTFFNCLLNRIRLGENHQSEELIRKFKVPDTFLQNEEIQKAASQGVIKASKSSTSYNVFEFAEKCFVPDSVFTSKEFRASAIQGVKTQLQNGSYDSVKWFLDKWEKKGAEPFSADERKILIEAAIKGLHKTVEHWKISLFDSIPRELSHAETIWEKLDAKEIIKLSPEAQRVREIIIERIIDSDRREYNLISALQRLDEALPVLKDHIIPSKLADKIRARAIETANGGSEYYFSQLLNYFPHVFTPDEVKRCQINAIESNLKAGRYSDARSYVTGLDLRPESFIEELGFEKQLEDGIALLIKEKSFQRILEIRRDYPQLIDKEANKEDFRKSVCDVFFTDENVGVNILRDIYVPPSSDEFGIIPEEDFGKPEFPIYEFEIEAIRNASKQAIADHNIHLAKSLFALSADPDFHNNFAKEHFDALCQELVSDDEWDNQKSILEWHTKYLKGQKQLLDRKEGGKLPVDIWLKNKLSSDETFTEEEFQKYDEVKSLLLVYGDQFFKMDPFDDGHILKTTNSPWECFTEEVEEKAKRKLIQTLKFEDPDLALKATVIFPFSVATLEDNEVRDAIRIALIKNCADDDRIEQILHMHRLYNPSPEEKLALEPYYTAYARNTVMKGEVRKVCRMYDAGILPESLINEKEFTNGIKIQMKDTFLSEESSLPNSIRGIEQRYIPVYTKHADESETFQKTFALTIDDLEEYLRDAIQIGGYVQAQRLLSILVNRDREHALKLLDGLKENLFEAAKQSTENGNFSAGYQFLQLKELGIGQAGFVDRYVLLDSMRKGFRYILEVEKNPARALGLLADLQLAEENFIIDENNLFGFSPAVLEYAQQEEIKTLKDLLTEFKSDPILTFAIAGREKLLSDKQLRKKGRDLGFSNGEAALALQENINLNKMSETDYLKVIDICSRVGGDWADSANIRDPFMKGAEVFGAARMFSYLSPVSKAGAPERKISKHDALHAFHAVLSLYEKSGLSKNEFYNQILEQVRRNGATYNVGSSYHRLNEIAQTASLDIEGVVKIASEYPDVNYLADVAEKFNTTKKVFESWKSLERFSKLETFVKRIEMLELIQELKNKGDEATASYVETLAFHPHSSVDLSAVEKFARNIEAFLDLEDGHTPANVHRVKKPSNLHKFDNLDLTPDGLRKALVNGHLDTLQRIHPLSATYKVTESGELYSIRGEIRRALGSKAEGIPGKAKDVKLLFHKLKNDLFREADIDFAQYLAGEAELPEELHDKFLEIIYDPKIGVKPPVLKNVVVRIHPKSSPEAVLAGDDTACCMKFGSGKANVYTFNLSCAQLTVQLDMETEEAPLRTIAQSVLTSDVDINKSIPVVIGELQSSNRNLSEILPSSVIESGNRYLAADNVEVNLNYKTETWGKTLEGLYSDFFHEYMTRYGEEGNYNTSIAPIGTGYSDALQHLRTAANTYAPEAPVGYSDKLGESVYMLDIKPRSDLLGVSYEENTVSSDIREERAGVSVATFSDTIPISYLESKIYSDNTTLIENLHRIENRFFAIAINNALNGYPELNLKFRANNKVLGYISAHQGRFTDSQYDVPLEEGEPIIYVADLAVHPDALTAVPRILSEFCDRYKVAYLDRGESIPMFAHLREKTSYKLLKQKVEWLEKKLGCELEFIEGSRYTSGDDTMVPVVIRPKLTLPLKKAA